MKKTNFFALLLLAAATAMMMVSCGSGNDPENKNKPSENKELTPEESKEKLMGVANKLIGKFDTEDQKAAIELADGLCEKYEQYSWEGVSGHFDGKYDNVFRLPSYAKQVVEGKRVPSAIDQSYTFSFEGESVIFEADDATRTWKEVGKANDNSIIFRFTDKNGNSCEAKAWGEGKTDTYEYSWDHWTAPKIYADASTALTIYGYAMIDGYQYQCYFDQTTNRWYYYKYDEVAQESKIYYIDEKVVTNRHAYDNYYQNYQFEEETGRWYYLDWNNEYVDGTRTIKGVLPKTINFTLKQGKTEVIRISLDQEIKMNDHVTFSVDAKVSNLNWTADVDLHFTHGNAAFAFLYGKEKLISVAVNLPSYTLIEKQDSQSWEEWAEQYSRRYEELLKKIGTADAVVDILGEVQAKVNINDFGIAYRDYYNWENNYRSYEKQGCDKFCEIINGNQTNGIYYNSDIKQAEIKAQTAVRNYESPTGSGASQEEFYPEIVIYFPADGTSYAIEGYFNHKPFTDLQYTIEDLANAYIRLSKLLFDEVGEISFD